MEKPLVCEHSVNGQCKAFWCEVKLITSDDNKGKMASLEHISSHATIQTRLIETESDIVGIGLCDGAKL